MDPDALLHPVGSLPLHVYWTRRAVMAAAAVAALVLIVHGLAGLGGTSARTTARTGRPPPSLVSNQAPSSVSSDSNASSTPTASPSTAPVATCADTALAIAAATDAGSFPAGVLPRLSISVRNVGATACRRDIGAGARRLTVRSGVDRIWSSDDCEGTARSVVTLAPGGTRSYAVRWSRHRSRPGCPSAGPLVRPGTYRLYASLGRIAAGPAVFTLR